jgi:hypothetical protein
MLENARTVDGQQSLLHLAEAFERLAAARATRPNPLSVSEPRRDRGAPFGRASLVWCQACHHQGGQSPMSDDNILAGGLPESPTPDPFQSTQPPNAGGFETGPSVSGLQPPPARRSSKSWAVTSDFEVTHAAWANTLIEHRPSFQPDRQHTPATAA